MNRLVLIVDDDPDLAYGMAAELERMNLTAVCALHYEAALGELEAGNVPRLICVDLELPTRSGYELCEHIRGVLGLAHVPVLVTSDSAFPEEMARAEEAGADAFMKKPFALRDFRAYVEVLLDATRLSQPDDCRAEA